MATGKKDVEPVKELFEDVLDILKKAREPQPAPANVNVDQLLEEMKGSLNDIQERSEELYKRSGMTKDQIEAFAANPNNFTPDEWSLLQQIREETEDFQRRTESLLAQSAKRPAEVAASEHAQKVSPKRVQKKDWKPT